MRGRYRLEKHAAGAHAPAIWLKVGHVVGAKPDDARGNAVVHQDLRGVIIALEKNQEGGVDI
jgi:hypothetical protein